MGLVRDPMFWKRFSTAVHLTEDLEKAPENEKEAVVDVKAKAGYVYFPLYRANTCNEPYRTRSMENLLEMDYKK